MQSFKKKFFNADGTLNKTVVASFITLLIVLVQQIMIACGFSYGHWDQLVGIINTVLTILGLCGFVEGNGEVQAPTTNTVSTLDNSKGDGSKNEAQTKQSK